MRKIIFISLIIFTALGIFAQDDLKCDTEDSITGLFSSNKITGASIVAQSEKSITIAVDLEGFDEEEFTLKGIMLSRKTSSSPVKGIDAEKVKVPKGGGSVELTFKFNDKEVRSSKAYLETKYVKFSAVKSTGLGELFEELEGLDVLNLSGVDLVCNCVKKWRISGASNPGSIEITVDLVPYGAAQNIKP